MGTPLVTTRAAALRILTTFFISQSLSFCFACS